MIILRGVNLFPTQIEELILQVPALSPHFQCELARPGRMDAMLLVRAADNNALRQVVLEQLQALPGVLSTRTILIFEDTTN